MQAVFDSQMDGIQCCTPAGLGIGHWSGNAPVHGYTLALGLQWMLLVVLMHLLAHTGL